MTKFAKIIQVIKKFEVVTFLQVIRIIPEKMHGTQVDQY